MSLKATSPRRCYRHTCEIILFGLIDWECSGVAMCTCARGLMVFPSGREGGTLATLGSWLWLVATKLKPRNSWCVFALGGMPGESRLANTSATTCTTRHLDFFISFGLECRHVNFDKCVLWLPVGVLEVNSGSKWKVSSGLPTVGLNGGLISFLYNF